MRSFSAIFVTFALAGTAFANPTFLRNIEKFEGKTSGKLIVKLKDGVPKPSVLAQIEENSNITHSWDVIHGFSGHFNSRAVNILRASPDIEYITEDGLMHALSMQTNAPWGLARLSQVDRLINQDTGALNYSYSYDASAGSGVDIYIIGVYTDHSQFGGRARWGATFGNYLDADGNGHGTHCAGTAAGSQFGVAKAASIIAVKVLDDQGFGFVSDIISGLNFVKNSAESSSMPSVASMSLGGPVSSSLDDSVAALVAAGIHVVVAAGNSNSDAAFTSPARVPSAVTVGASTIADARASFSNYGPVVDIFAPGQSVISSWIGNTAAMNTISGTSMATPHVAGLIAYLIGRDGNISPAEINQHLQSMSAKNKLTDIPSSTVNDLAQNSG